MKERERRPRDTKGTSIEDKWRIKCSSNDWRIANERALEAKIIFSLLPNEQIIRTSYVLRVFLAIFFFRFSALSVNATPCFHTTTTTLSDTTDISFLTTLKLEYIRIVYLLASQSASQLLICFVCFLFTSFLNRTHKCLPIEISFARYTKRDADGNSPYSSFCIDCVCVCVCISSNIIGMKTHFILLGLINIFFFISIFMAVSVSWFNFQYRGI